MGRAPALRGGCALVLSLTIALGVVDRRASFAGEPAPKPASSSSASPAARSAQLKVRGDAAFDDKRYAEALAAYGEAYAAAPSPVLLYNQGRALQFLGRFPAALEFLRRFRAEAPRELRARVPTLDALIDELEGKVGVLAIDVDAEGATVVFGERKLGVTPLPPTSVNAGVFSLEISADGRKPYRATSEIVGRKTTTISAKLAAKSTQGVLVVRSATAGARVSVDGVFVGAAPVERSLVAGEHAIEVEADGHETARSSIVLAAGARRELSIDLHARPALTSQWWFWAGVGVVAAAGVTTVVLLRTERSPDHGSFSPGTVSASLVRF